MLFLFEQEEAVRRYGNRKLQEGIEMGMEKGMAKMSRNTARRIVRNGGDVQMIMKLTDLTEAEARRIFDEETGDDKGSKHE